MVSVESFVIASIIKTAIALFVLLTAVAYGAIASAILPSDWGYDTARNWGPVPLECWVLAGSLYMVTVAAVQASPNVKRILAFSRPALQTSVPPGAVVDVASEAGEAPGAEPRPIPAI